MPLKNSNAARIAYADLIRLIAILMVVLIHSAAPLFNILPVTSGSFAVSVLLDGIAHAGVPLFVMVSGIFLLDEKREVTVRRAVKHYALPLVGLYFFWSFLYAAANKIAIPLLFENAALSADMARNFGIAVLEGAYHMWYLPMMVGLYLITPLLRSFVRDNCRHLVRWFLLIVFAVRFVLPTVIRLIAEFTGVDFSTAYNNFHLLAGWEYPAYYVAGWYIANTRATVCKRRAVYVTGAVSLIVMLVLTWWLSVRQNEAYDSLIEQTSLFCCLYAVALFALVAWEGNRLQPSKLLTRLSALSFGVYIIHVEIQQLYKLLLPYQSNAAAYILIQWIVVTAMSFASAFVLSRIPKIKRLVRG